MTIPMIQRPPLPTPIQTYVDNGLRMGDVFPGMPHASSTDKPRPMENWSLADHRELREHFTSAIRKKLPKSLLTIFWNNRYSVPIDQGMSVSTDHLWWVVFPGDLVLLTDGGTHHYTLIRLVDRRDETISFLDPWPDDFFLQAGRNVLGIRADGCRITRTDFEQTAVGILTWDTTDLLDHYFEAFPDQATNAEQRVRAGHSIMAAGPEYLASYAVKHFVKAMLLAGEAGDKALASNAAAQAWLAGYCASAAAKIAGNEKEALLIYMMIALPSHRLPEEEMLALLTPYQLCRLANSAGGIGDIQLVERATRLAIEKNQEFEDAYWLRAVAHVRSEPASALADIRRALDLNMSMIQQLERELDRLERPVFRGPTEHKRDREHHRRINELNVLVAAAFNSGHLLESREALYELCMLNPGDMEVLRKRLVIEQVLCDEAGIQTAAIEILRNNPPPELRAEAESALERARHA